MEPAVGFEPTNNGFAAWSKGPGLSITAYLINSIFYKRKIRCR